MTQVFRTGDRVKVKDQDIHGEIVRWDGAKAVVLDDDRADWMEEDDDGTLTYRLEDLVKWGNPGRAIRWYDEVVRIDPTRLDKSV